MSLSSIVGLVAIVAGAPTRGDRVPRDLSKPADSVQIPPRRFRPPPVLAAPPVGAAPSPTVPNISATILFTKHNLSVSGPGSIRATSETEICVFCHVPHNADPRGALWSRFMSDEPYEVYDSSTLRLPLGQPDGASKLCLSCHDGTIAVGLIRGRGRIQMQGTDAGGALPRGRSNLGRDLRSSHPVSVELRGKAGELHEPPRGRVRLDAAQKLQCTSCHDPHRNDGDRQQGKFLVEPNAFSAMCLACHAPRGWESEPSAHEASQLEFPASRGNHTPYPTVAETGCMGCHRSHNAVVGTTNLVAAGADACLRCHDGRVDPRNLTAEFQKPYSHPIFENVGVHDPAEGQEGAKQPLPERALGAPRHVQCVDCHNPHAANAAARPSPLLPGALAEVWGIDQYGRRVDPATYEYEICFKCHADSANLKGRHNRGGIDAAIRRQVDQPNLRLAFDPAGPSAHPVLTAARGRSRLKPVLLDRFGRDTGTMVSQITCSDCHASDGDVKGPHGSSYPYLLEREYRTEDHAMESQEAYALCYKCHDRKGLLGPDSAFPHQSHVVRGQAPCSACHTAHGIDAMQGSPLANSSLINFDLDIVHGEDKTKRLQFRGAGGAGACTLQCHGKNHVESAYP
ncbi:MAG: hypothetical protein HY903_14000 [Deltaproteobacteria bacterium]|nr:hypothetical protein [Deltaproteobacteria bacterium]